mmetsp:Transcript_32181/g.41271  ORF Transcript_32181/g.41271 Transcript_32181/m.41271 type:complete len:200 (+) Transcript_32181:67-666(+)
MKINPSPALAHRYFALKLISISNGCSFDSSEFSDNGKAFICYMHKCTDIADEFATRRCFSFSKELQRYYCGCRIEDVHGNLTPNQKAFLTFSQCTANLDFSPLTLQEKSQLSFVSMLSSPRIHSSTKISASTHISSPRSSPPKWLEVFNSPIWYLANMDFMHTLAILFISTTCSTIDIQTAADISNISAPCIMRFPVAE